MKKNLFLAVCFCLMLSGVALAQTGDSVLDTILAFDNGAANPEAVAQGIFADYFGVAADTLTVHKYNSFTYNNKKNDGCYDITPNFKDGADWEYAILTSEGKNASYIIVANGKGIYNEDGSFGEIDWSTKDARLFVQDTSLVNTKYNQGFFLTEGYQGELTPDDGNDGGNAVPEPSSIILLGSALLGLAAFGKRKLGNRK